MVFFNLKLFSLQTNKNQFNGCMPYFDNKLDKIISLKKKKKLIIKFDENV